MHMYMHTNTHTNTHTRTFTCTCPSTSTPTCKCTRTSISTSLKQIHQESPVYPDQGVPAPSGTNKVSYHNDTIFTNPNQVCCFKCGQWLDTRKHLTRHMKKVHKKGKVTIISSNNKFIL